MPKITPIHWRKFEKFLLFVGCSFRNQEGDHRIYVGPGLKRPLVVPQETSIPVFIIRNNLRVLGISHNEYLEIIGKI